MLLTYFNRKEYLRHRAVSLRQHGFLVFISRVTSTLKRYAVAEWYGAGLTIAGSNPTNGCCVTTPTQRAIPPGSVNEYQRKLESKRAYHVMH